MQDNFEAALSIRRLIGTLLFECSEEQLDYIPKPFTNNLRWQVAHIITTQYILTYKLANSPIPVLSDEFLIKTRKGSQPNDLLSNPELFTKNKLITLLNETTTRLIEDYFDLSNMKYTQYVTSMGFQLNNVDQGLMYSNMHDSIHYGFCSSIKKLI
jgi:hypothetical protein